MSRARAVCPFLSWCWCSYNLSISEPKRKSSIYSSRPNLLLAGCELLADAGTLDGHSQQLKLIRCSHFWVASLSLSPEPVEPSPGTIPVPPRMWGDSLRTDHVCSLSSQEDCARGPTILAWRSHVRETCSVLVTKPAGDRTSASVHQGSSESAQVQRGWNY